MTQKPLLKVVIIRHSDDIVAVPYSRALFRAFESQRPDHEEDQFAAVPDPWNGVEVIDCTTW